MWKNYAQSSDLGDLRRDRPFDPTMEGKDEAQPPMGHYQAKLGNQQKGGALGKI
ncbi:hypothetical protein [Laspinema sp. D2d]|uniref:hypothetical protein n=1 Tax=Laspinema sp. D2d TaxID=2953686 RepID=UPI0021BBA4BE|nr:hypothetical protein [Laspinema sp. D2d]